MHQSGIENVVSSSGTSLTPGQIRLIHRFTENVTVIYDGDAAGIKASIRGIDLLLEEGLNIKVLLLPDGDDPDSFARKHNASDFIEFVEQNSLDFIRFKANLLLVDAGNDPVKRAGLVIDIVRSISIIPNSVIRAEYVKECSTILNVEEAMLYHQINQLKTNEKKSPEANKQTNSDQFPPPDFFEIEPNMGFESKYDNEERNILQQLIRYGQSVMFYADADKPEPVTVGTFILEEFEHDNLRFQNSLHQQILEEYKQHCIDETFNVEKFFLYHSNTQISQLAANLITEKYALSKVHSKVKKVDTDGDRLIDLIPRVIYEFKNSLILQEIRQKLIELKAASDAKNSQLANKIMIEMAGLENVKKQLSKELGERIIIKI